jgi:hypothetical protein
MDKLHIDDMSKGCRLYVDEQCASKDDYFHDGKLLWRSVRQQGVYMPASGDTWTDACDAGVG